MATAATEQTSPDASSSVPPAPAVTRIVIETWHEEAFTLTISVVRDLSAGNVRRDPRIAPRARTPKPEPVIVTRKQSTIRSKWQLDLQKRAWRTGKTVDELREEERVRGLERRKAKREQGETQ